MEEEVREAANIQFFRKRLYRTREETAVLIYISVFERRVCVLGDRGINVAIPEVTLEWCCRHDRSGDQGRTAGGRYLRGCRRDGQNSSGGISRWVRRPERTGEPHGRKRTTLSQARLHLSASWNVQTSRETHELGKDSFLTYRAETRRV